MIFSKISVVVVQSGAGDGGSCFSANALIVAAELYRERAKTRANVVLQNKVHMNDKFTSPV